MEYEKFMPYECLLPTNVKPCCCVCNSSKRSKNFGSLHRSNGNQCELGCTYEEILLKPFDYESLVGQGLWNEYKE